MTERSSVRSSVAITPNTTDMRYTIAADRVTQDRPQAGHAVSQTLADEQVTKLRRHYGKSAGVGSAVVADTVEENGAVYVQAVMDERGVVVKPATYRLPGSFHEYLLTTNLDCKHYRPETS